MEIPLMGGDAATFPSIEIAERKGIDQLVPSRAGAN